MKGPLNRGGAYIEWNGPILAWLALLGHFVHLNKNLPKEQFLNM